MRLSFQSGRRSTTRSALHRLCAGVALCLPLIVSPDPVRVLSLAATGYTSAIAKDGHGGHSGRGDRGGRHGSHGGWGGGGWGGGGWGGGGWGGGDDGGKNGDNGSDGDAGKSGDNGSDGDNGKSGDNGSDGDNGKSGDNGSDGNNGKSGDNGSDGDNGKSGDNGSDGNNGKSGDNGKNGKNGKGVGTKSGDDNNGKASTGKSSKAKDKKSVVSTPVVEAPAAAPETSASGDAPGAADHKSGEVVGVGMSDADVSAAEAMGFSVATPVAQPKSLETPVVELMVPKGMDEDEARHALAAAFPGRAFGLNNVYSGYHTSAATAANTSKSRAGGDGGDARCASDQCYGRVMIGWQQSLETCSAGVAIGMIDTGIDLDSTAFAGSAIVAKRFSPAGSQEEGYGHATGVAALIVGNGQIGTPGLLPKARLVAADVFYLDQGKHVVTDTASLLKALDWLDQAGVKIINMSFSGPHDDLVAKAIANMSAKGVVFVAAAGNNGAGAAPAYPAAYDEVIAVTAVDSRMRAYIQANQGAYIDVSAPGVRIWTAAPRNKSAYQSGTSFAVPFVTAALAAELTESPEAARQWLATAGLDDIGEPGADAVFGRGLLRAPQSCGATPGGLFSGLPAAIAPAETASTSVAQR